MGNVAGSRMPSWSWKMEQQKVKKRLHWRLGYNRGFGNWLQSKQSVQENQTGLVQARITEHKATNEECLVLSDRHNYPSLGTNREIKTEDIVQAYPVDVDNFNYK